MPIKTIQITTCNLCGSEQERELFTKSPAELDGWITFTVKNAKDLREKLECAVCASCAERIADLKQEREAEAAAGIVPPAVAPPASVTVNTAAPEAAPASTCSDTYKGKRCELAVGHKGDHRCGDVTWPYIPF